MLATEDRTVVETIHIREPWVGLKELARHLGFGYATARKMVIAGLIPGGKPFCRGKNIHWRFKLSVVDALMEQDRVDVRRSDGL